MDNGAQTKDTDYKDSKDFQAEKKENKYDLKITEVKSFHRAVYYCACWDSASHSKYYCKPPAQKLQQQDVLI